MDILTGELQSIFGPVLHETKDGEEINVICPQCIHRMHKPDRSGHLGLNFTKGVGKCVRCGFKVPDLRRFLRERGYSGASPGMPLKEYAQTAKDKMLAKFAPKPDPVFIDQIVKYSDDWVPIRQAPHEYAKSLLKKGLSHEIQKRWGLMACVKGEQEGYVIFPFLEFGDLVYWQGRAAWSTLLRKYSPPLDMGSGYWVYNYPKDRKKVLGRTVIVTEGTLDCISCVEVLRDTPFENQYWAISLQGTSMSTPTPERHILNTQFGKIRSLNPSLVLIMLDPEERKKAELMAQSFRSHGIPSRAVVYPHGCDPNKLFQQNPDLLLKCLTSRILL